MFQWISANLNWFTRFNVFVRINRFYWVLTGSRGFPWVLKGLNRFYRFLAILTGFYLVLAGFNGF